MKKITVIGSTGMIGTPVTKELINAGFEVTALVRDINKAKQIFPTGVKFVKGDLNDKTSIIEALKNAEGLYINISTKPENKESDFNPEIEGLDNILYAAKQSNVKRVAFLSSLMARNYQGDWWVMSAKKQGISKIKNAGIQYTIFYPSNFMENFNNGIMQRKKATIMGKPIYKAWWIAGEDFGKQVAASFGTEKAINKDYPVQGLEGLNMEEAATIYVKNYTKEKFTVSFAPMPIMKFLALFIKPLKFVIQLMAVMMNNKETFEAQTTWDELGNPTITLEKFANL